MASFSLAVLVSFAVMVFANGQLRVCYYSNWSHNRSAPRQFFPADIDPFLCSHMVFAFAQVKEPRYELTFMEWNDLELYRQFNDKNDTNSLKSRNPNIKTLLATGGWYSRSEVYSDMAANEGRRKNFAKKAVKFLRELGFDGLNMDWEYPALRGGREDKWNFRLLLQDLMAEINDDTNINPGRLRLLLTATVSARKSIIDAAYDISEMAKYLDFINLMTYDFHGAWESVVGLHSPLYARPSEKDEQATLNMDWAARYWEENEAPKEKLIIGLATYGRSFTLRNSTDNQIGDPSAGPGIVGQYTREADGFLAYFEICTMLSEGANRYWEPDQKVPYLVSGDQWVGYEDEESILLKLEYIKQNGYGGAMVWNVDLDDFNKLCRLSKRPYPLMSLIREVFDSYIPPSTERPTGGSTDPTTSP